MAYEDSYSYYCGNPLPSCSSVYGNTISSQSNLREGESVRL